MKKSIIALFAVCAIAATSCKDFLEQQNPNKIESEFYFTDATALEIYANGLLRSWLPDNTDVIFNDQYADIYSWDGTYDFYTDVYNSEKSSGWASGNWSYLRSCNYFLANLRKAEADDDVLNHYEGVGRLFRALFYISKVQTFGDVPWYDQVIEPDSQEDLYKARDSRELVCQNILKDLDFACDNLFGDASYRVKASMVNKYVALGMKARFCLYEGTYRKYHKTNPSTGKAWTSDESKTYLQECVKACEAIMNSGIYSLSNNYRDMFINEDACSVYAANEFIFARDYDLGLNVVNASYSVNDYFINAQHKQICFNRDFVMTYLMKDGTCFTDKYDEPFKVGFIEECKDRDPRMAATMRTPGFTRADGATSWGAPDFTFAKTGYQPVKWLTNYVLDAINDKTAEDVPLIRYAEILLSYAEAKCELGQFDENIWNKTVKLVRERAGVKAVYPTKADPYMQAYFLNTVTDKCLLEIRRERGIEFTMENLRQHDVRRWAMGELLIKQKTGLWIDGIEKDLDLNNDGIFESYVSKTIKEKSGRYVLDLAAAAGHKLSEGDKGYILPNTALVKSYTWSDKKYLTPIPKSAIIANPNLTQNNGWE